MIVLAIESEVDLLCVESGVPGQAGPDLCGQRRMGDALVGGAGGGVVGGGRGGRRGGRGGGRAVGGRGGGRGVAGLGGAAREDEGGVAMARVGVWGRGRGRRRARARSRGRGRGDDTIGGVRALLARPGAAECAEVACALRVAEGGASGGRGPGGPRGA